MSTGIKAAFRQHDYPLPIVRGPFDGQMNGRHLPYHVQPYALRIPSSFQLLMLVAVAAYST
jgi:hypothetical protein